MSLKVRKELSALKVKVKENCVANPVFCSDLLEWIEAQREIFLEILVLENDNELRGKIQMLDSIKNDIT